MLCAFAACLAFTFAAGPQTNAVRAASTTAVIAIHEEPLHLNPILGPQMSYATLVEEPMFPNLFRIAPNGSLVPDLAQGVPTEANGGVSKDGLTYVIHLRKGVSWSDGRPFNAQDVIETWRLIVDPRVRALTTEGYDQIAKAEAPDDHTVRFTLKSPYSPFLAACWSDSQDAILPAHVFTQIGPSGVNDAAYNDAPNVTLGPFRFSSWKHGAAITLEANPHYYGAKPKLAQIVFQVMPDQNTILSSLQAGSVNLAQVGPTQVATLKSNSAVQLFIFDHPSWEAAALNGHDPILADARVRRALEYGIDRQAIVEHVLRGYGTPIADAVVPSSWAYDPSIKPYPFSAAMAAKLLDEAGWKMGSDGVRHKDGKPLELTYSTTSGNPGREEAEQIMQQELGAVGVRLDIHNYPASVLFGDVLFHGKFQIAEFQPTGGPDPHLRIYRADSCHAFPPEGANYGFWCDRRIDPLFEKDQAATDRGERKKYFSQIARIESEEMPYLYLYSVKAIVATSRLAGYEPNAYTQPAWNSEMWSAQ
jgi:peptide/nickel transport system substrate-binding protein